MSVECASMMINAQKIKTVSKGQQQHQLQTYFWTVAKCTFEHAGLLRHIFQSVYSLPECKAKAKPKICFNNWQGVYLKTEGH